MLQAAGFAVEVRPSHVDESPLAGESVVAMVQRLCRMKAEACPVADHPVVAADTLVSLEGEALGQPEDMAAARTMIKKLSGKAHDVYTAVCVRKGSRVVDAMACTTVRFRELAEDEIDLYLEHNDVLDKAGAYAVQAGAASFVVAVDGPMDNVIGLPVALTKELLLKVEEMVQ